MTNMAKDTKDPRVDFCLPKKLLYVISQVPTQILIKFHLQKSRPSINFQNLNQISAFQLNLIFKMLTKPSFRI